MCGARIFENYNTSKVHDEIKYEHVCFSSGDMLKLIPFATLKAHNKLEYLQQCQQGMVHFR